MPLQNSPPKTMSRKITQLTLFASSTSETSAEISALRTVIEALNKQLDSTHAINIRMLAWPDDVRPGVNRDSQSEITRQVAGYDIYLGLLGTRFGTPTARSKSGTQEEFEAALARFKADTTSVRLLFYFKKSLTGIDPYKLDVKELGKVQRFRDDLEARGVLYCDFEATEHFIELVKAHLFDLIVKEWRENDRWASIDGPAPKPPPNQERPEAVLDKRSGGNAAKPMTRAHESKRHALPDEEDLEESDEDEPGLLDHVQNLHSASNAMVETFQNMSEHITTVGKKLAKRTEEIGAVQQSQAKARKADGATQQHNAIQFKTIINGAADDILNFVSELSQDVNAYRADNRVMLSEFHALLAVRQELNTENNDATERDSLLQLIETMKTVKGQVGGFQDVMQKTPALTKQFKRARRRGVSMLGELIAEISFSIDETEALAQELCDETSATEMPSGASG